MKNALIIAVLTILVLAILLAVKAFVWVFSSVFYYGCLALTIALLIFGFMKLRGMFKREDNGKK